MNRIALALIIGLLTIATGSTSAHAAESARGDSGACCIGGDCYQTTVEECEAVGGGWSGGPCDNCTCSPCGTCCDGVDCYEDVSQDDCAFFGDWYGSTPCADIACGPPTGACCWEYSCYDVTEEECYDFDSLYAVWLGEGTSCATDKCPPPAGACCDGFNCYSTLETNCDGIFYDSMDCYEGLCDEMGTCCLDGQCLDEYFWSDCENSGGTYLGYNVSCSDDPCISPDGACCLGENSCIQITNSQGENLCENIFGGYWMGDGTDCDDFSCIIGACCFVDLDQNSYCADGYTSESCELGGGDYFFGDGTTCADDGSACVTIFGACCFGGTNCENNVSQLDCTTQGGQFFGADSTCAGEASTCAVGACCINYDGYLYCEESSYDDCWYNDGSWSGGGTNCEDDAPNCNPGDYGACCFWGECYEMYQSECSWSGGSWAGGPCDSCTCAAACGTCCFGESCNEDVGSDECEAAGGTFLGNVSCTTEPCAPPAPTGACCVDGQCTIETEEDCSGLYLGDDLPCDNNPCGDDGGDGPFIGIRYDVLGTNLVTDDEETWTVDVYAVLADGCRLDAVAGDINQSKMVSTTGSFYQNIYGGPTSQDINPSLFSAFPDLEYDSFVTIGLTDQNGNALSNIGIDWTDFEAGGAIDSTDGSWYVTPEDVQGDSGTFQDQFCEDNNGVRIARLTVRGLDSIVFFEALFQGKDGGGTTWQANDSMAIAYDDCDAPTSCPGDINLDGNVDVLDLLQVIATWGPCGSCPADVDGNGVVDVIDLLEVIANWGPCPEEICPEGWSCGDLLTDYVCGDIESTCHCIELPTGTSACVDVFSAVCSDYPVCTSGDGCPDGYECVTMSCCPTPICMPICE